MTDNSRSHGVELGSLDDDLEELEYPTTAQKLTDEFGDREIELEDGVETFGTVLGPYLTVSDGMEEGERFDSPEAVRDAVMNLVGDDAVGRDAYSDRGLDTDDQTRNEESI